MQTWYRNPPPSRNVFRVRSCILQRKHTIHPVYMIFCFKDFFTGGSGTMSKTMAYGILYLIHNPDVQDRVQAEIDLVEFFLMISIRAFIERLKWPISFFSQQRSILLYNCHFSLLYIFVFLAYVAGNWGNQAFPEIPWHFRKCLGNWGISGIA